MALIKILKDSIGTGIRKNLAQGNDLLIGPNATVTSTDDVAITALFSNQAITVRGTVSSDATDTIVMGDAATDTGLKLLVEKGAEVFSFSDAVTITGRNAQVENRGTMAASNAVELNVTGPGQSVVRNSGVMSGEDNCVTSIGDQNVRVINTGRMFAGDADAIELDLGNDTVINKGVLQGEVILGGGNDVLNNSTGRIFGAILGNEGNDRFVLGAGREDIDGGDGTDTLDFRGGPGVKVALDGSFAGTGRAKNDTYLNFENVFGSQKADTIRGDINNNLLNGFGGNDRILATPGQDTLIGGAGKDTLNGGGTGDDFFRFKAPGEGGDRIADFSSDVLGDNDTIEVSAAGFKGGLVAGVLAAGRFKSGANNQAGDGNDRFIFREGDTTLWFDRDGKGGQGPVLIADLQAGATMTAADIFVL